MFHDQLLGLYPVPCCLARVEHLQPELKYRGRPLCRNWGIATAHYLPRKAQELARPVDGGGKGSGLGRGHHKIMSTELEPADVHQTKFASVAYLEGYPLSGWRTHTVEELAHAKASLAKMGASQSPTAPNGTATPGLGPG